MPPRPVRLLFRPVPYSRPDADGALSDGDAAGRAHPDPLFNRSRRAARSGRGSASARCDRSRSGSVFLADLDAAIDQVVREHPDYFNLDEQQGPGGYRLLKREAYVAAVIGAAEKRGLCAAVDMFGEILMVKRGDEQSEEFAIETPRSFLRRGESSYAVTCTPPPFPSRPKTWW